MSVNILNRILVIALVLGNYGALTPEEFNLKMIDCIAHYDEKSESTYWECNGFLDDIPNVMQKEEDENIHSEILENTLDCE